MQNILISGATSLIGHYLLPRLTQPEHHLIALSRQAPHKQNSPTDFIEWRQADLTQPIAPLPPVDILIHLAVIWHLPNLLSQLSPPYPRRIIAISSTSRFSKQTSSSAAERATAQALTEAEEALIAFATTHGIQWTILRPTLIYAAGRDKNIATITRFIRRFKFFPLLGQATGLRQPLHADDIAQACIDCLAQPSTYQHAYDLSGGETLSYQQMVERIFNSLNQTPRFIHIPLPLFHSAIQLLRYLPPYRSLTPEMATRMNTDLVFPHTQAKRDFNFAPRRFSP